MGQAKLLIGISTLSSLPYRASNYVMRSETVHYYFYLANGRKIFTANRLTFRHQYLELGWWGVGGFVFVFPGGCHKKRLC